MNVTSTQDRWSAFTERLFAQNQFAIKLGLDSMNRALHLSGHTHLSHRVVLVAGTNGKGTIASTIAALLHASGLRVGLYTSPHIRDLSERFRVDGDIVSQEDILAVAEPIMDAFSIPGANPCLTFFELTTLMAIQLFERQRVDVAIYEVGLGGRLDATNALQPDLCVLATVGYDHQLYLGETLGEILNEKLGISRPDVPLFVSGQEYDEVHRALTLLPHTPLYCAHRNLGLRMEFDPEHPSNSDDIIWWYCAGARRTLHISDWGQFIAPYQRRHVATALAAAGYLSSQIMGRDESSLMVHAARTIATMRWPGRLDLVQLEDSSVELLCDAAHNADGMRGLLSVLESMDYSPDVVMCSGLKDKDLEGMWRPLHAFLMRCGERHGCTPRFVAISLDNARAASPSTLHDLTDRIMIGCDAEVMPVHDALLMLKGRAGAQHVLVCGSIYLLGELWEAMDHPVL